MIRATGSRGAILMTTGPISWHILSRAFRNETVLIENVPRLPQLKEPKPIVLQPRYLDHLAITKPYQEPQPKHHNTNSFQPRNKVRCRMQKQSRKINRK